uniref:Glycosyltransferase n=1 Tax=Aegilops tauschii subsp. strangulata TaxID=200361 RepID=A0A452XV76_AEGTS
GGRREAARRVPAGTGARAHHADAGDGQAPARPGLPLHLRQHRVQPSPAAPLPRDGGTRRPPELPLRRDTRRAPPVRGRRHPGRPRPVLRHGDHLSPPPPGPSCQAQRPELRAGAADHLPRRRRCRIVQLRCRGGARRALRRVVDVQCLRVHGIPPLPSAYRPWSCAFQRRGAADGQRASRHGGRRHERHVRRHTAARLPDDDPHHRPRRHHPQLLNYVMREAERLSLPDAVLLNTFDALEQPVLDAMRAVLPPMYTVGPLHLHASNVVPTGTPLDGLGSNLWKEQDGLLAWLDGHGAGAVVYVNYGSVAVMTNEQLLEFGWGLADSGYAFIWNVRPDLVRGETAVMPPEFLASVHGRAMLTTWCPQAEVLGHEAVGVFLTHSGWNSTLESISAVVPMLCWPFAGEQQTNCRDGDRRRGEAGGSGGDDTRGDGGGKGTGDEAACGGVEGEGPACVAARWGRRGQPRRGGS